MHTYNLIISEECRVLQQLTATKLVQVHETIRNKTHFVSTPWSWANKYTGIAPVGPKTAAKCQTKNACDAV